MITNPFASDFNPGTVYGIIAAISGAILVVLLRLLGRTEEPVTVALWHNLVGAVGYPIIMIMLGDALIFTDIVASSLLLMCFFGLAASFCSNRLYLSLSIWRSGGFGTHSLSFRACGSVFRLADLG